MSKLDDLCRRLAGAPEPNGAEAVKDDIDLRLSETAARLAKVRRREAEYRRFRDEYEARRPRSDDDG
jgi:hypothetical protein